MTADMEGLDGDVERTKGGGHVGHARLRTGLLLVGAVAFLGGGVLLIEELVDALRDRPEFDETFAALVVIAIGSMALAAGGSLATGPRRLGAAFWVATLGIALATAGAAFGLGLLVDLGTMGALALSVGLLLAVPFTGGLLAAIIDRRWAIAGGLAVTAVLVGIGLVAAVVAAVASGAEVPAWVWLLDD